MNNKQNNVVQTFLSAGKKVWCRHSCLQLWCRPPACNYFVSSWHSVQSVDNPVDRCGCRRRAAAFTLIEMLVALSILIILMAAVGEIFSIAGRTVRLGQATLAAMSSVRAVEAQISHDIKHLDQNGFLIIRQRYYAPYWQTGVQYEPGDEVEYNNSSGTFDFYLCQQANVTQSVYSGTPPSIPGGTSTTDWQPLQIPNTAPVAGDSTYPIWRADQICFMETGDFHSRTGSVQGGNATMASYLTANKALVWFGQFSASYGAAGYNFPNPTAYVTPSTSTEYQEIEKPYWPQNAWVPLGTPPSGETSGQFYFGREAMLLIPQGTPLNYPNGIFNGTAGSVIYNNPFYPGSTTTDGSSTANGGSDGYPQTIVTVYSGSPARTISETSRATVTSSRLDAAYDSVPTSTSGAISFLKPAPSSPTISVAAGTGTLEGYINSLPLTPAANSLYDIANLFGYRYSTLPTPGASEIGYTGSTPPANPLEITQQALNGYYRMTPIMLQGVPSFAVDWTDGVEAIPTIPTGQTVNQLEWYGLDGNTGTYSYPTIANPNGPDFSSLDINATTPIAIQGNSYYSGTAAADGLVYVFYAGNRPYWPKALKITYCVTDPNNRLQGGRWITQVVNLPQ